MYAKYTSNIVTEARVLWKLDTQAYKGRKLMKQNMYT